jgi:hypothetical protein
MGAGKMMMNTLRHVGDGPRAELGMRLRILKMMQNWIQYLTMQNLSSFSVTFSLALRIGLQDVRRLLLRLARLLLRLARLLQDSAARTNRRRATNRRRHAWTGKTAGTVLRERRHAWTGTESRRRTPGRQTANCNACTALRDQRKPGRENRSGGATRSWSSLLIAVFASRKSR